MRNRVAPVLAAAALLAALHPVSANSQKKAVAAMREFLKQIPEDQKILQALNRLTFGPRPRDAQAVKAMGLKQWLDQQLHPDTIPENPVLLDKLKPMDTLQMSGQELVRNYPSPQI